MRRLVAWVVVFILYAAPLLAQAPRGLGVRVPPVAVAGGGGSDDPHAASPVTLPTAWVDWTLSLPTGCTEIDVGDALPGGCAIITVDAGQDFQTALDTAASRTGATSDIIRLERFGVSGAVFEDDDGTGYRMPARSGTGWTYVMTSGTVTDEDDRLVPILGGTCGDPGAVPCNMTENTDLDELAVIRGTGTTPYYAIDAEQGAQNWRFIGIKWEADAFASALVRTYQDGLGAGVLPTSHHILFDRNYIAGSRTVGANVCLVFAGLSTGSGSHVGIKDSYVADCWVKDAEAKGILATSVRIWSVINTYVESSGIEVYSDMSDATYNPSDGEVVGSHLSKPLAWNTDATFVTNKNCFEVKSGVRILFHGNYCDNVWVEAQETAINIKIGDELPEKFTEHITIRKNIVANSANALKMCSMWCNDPSGNVGGNFAAYNNLFNNINGAAFGGDDDGHGMCFFHMIAGNGVYIVSHNTCINTGPMVGLTGAADGGDYGGLDFSDNIGRTDVDPFTTADADDGWTLGYTYTDNLQVGGTCANFPAGNQCPVDNAAVGFENFAGGNYRLATSSDYKGDGTDSYDVGTTDPGANIDAVEVATACSVTGQCVGAPPPPLLFVVKPSPLKAPVSARPEPRYRVAL